MQKVAGRLFFGRAALKTKSLQTDRQIDKPPANYDPPRPHTEIPFPYREIRRNAYMAPHNIILSTRRIYVLISGQCYRKDCLLLFNKKVSLQQNINLRIKGCRCSSMSVCVSGGRRDKTEGANCGVGGGGGDGGAIVIGPYIRDCPGSHQTREGEGKGKGRPGRCSDQMGMGGKE